MTSISTATEKIINRSPFLREAMTENLINISALARKILPEIEDEMGKKVKEGAIVMAIKRMSPGLYHKLDIKIKNVIGSIGDFLVRSDLVDFTYENIHTLNTSQDQLMKLVHDDKDSFFAICKGITETTYILSSKYKSEVERIFASQNKIAHEMDLSSITIKLPEANSDICGVYYYIMKHLAWEGINIKQVVSTTNEFTVIVNSDDIDGAFGILMQLKRQV